MRRRTERRSGGYALVAEHGAARAHAAARALEHDARALRPQGRDGRALADAHAHAEHRAPQPVGERDRIEHTAAVAVPDAAERERRVDLGARRRGIERLGVAAEAPDQLDLLVDLVHLVALGRDPEHAVALEAGVDAVARERT